MSSDTRTTSPPRSWADSSVRNSANCPPRTCPLRLSRSQRSCQSIRRRRTRLGQGPAQGTERIGHFVKFGWAKEIKAIAVMPPSSWRPAKARGVLPDTYSRKDMVSLLSMTL